MAWQALERSLSPMKTFTLSSGFCSSHEALLASCFAKASQGSQPRSSLITSVYFFPRTTPGGQYPTGCPTMSGRIAWASTSLHLPAAARLTCSSNNSHLRSPKPPILSRTLPPWSIRKARGDRFTLRAVAIFLARLPFATSFLRICRLSTISLTRASGLRWSTMTT